jgi:hypothetical protein
MAVTPKMGGRVKTLPWLVLIAAFAAGPAAAQQLHVLVVTGLGGEPEYEERFAEEAGKLAAAARKAAADDSKVVKLEGAAAKLGEIERVFKGFEQLRPDDSLAVYLVGHGSYDGHDYKFNIPGPDLTARRLAALLDKVPAERQLLVNTSSSSGAMLGELERPGRVVITATKSGRERNATIFGKYFAAAFEDPAADVDKNGTITAQEAFDYAEAKVKTFFESADRLATEHPQLEGGLARSFVLTRLGREAELARDPELAPLLEKREQLEMKVDQLKLRKDAMPEDEYFDSLQDLLLDLAKLQQEIDEKGGQ